MTKRITLTLRGGRFGPPEERLFQFDTDAFRRDANLADKVIAVTRRPSLPLLDIAAIEQTNKDFGLGIPIVIGMAGRCWGSVQAHASAGSSSSCSTMIT